MRFAAMVLVGLAGGALTLPGAMAQDGFSGQGVLQERQLPRGGWLGEWLSSPLPGKAVMPPRWMAAQNLPMIDEPPKAISPPPALPLAPLREKWLSDWLSGPLPGQAESPKPMAAVPLPAAPLPDFQPIHPLLENGAAAPPSSPAEEAPKQELKQEEAEAQNLAPALEGDFNDPLEPFNRAVFEFNEILQYVLLRPLAAAYNWLPEMVRGSVSSFLLNLKSPVILANDVLQAEPLRAMQTGARMFINSTVGLGGMFDAANLLGVAPHDEDFGQTMAVWGVSEMFYLVLPVIGPTNPRDVIGKFGVDAFLDPFGYYLHNNGYSQWIWARAAASGFDEYASLVDEMDHIKSTSMDYYAAIRSMYRQRREREILNGREPPLQDVPDYE